MYVWGLPPHRGVQRGSFFACKMHAGKQTLQLILYTTNATAHRSLCVGAAQVDVSYSV